MCLVKSHKFPKRAKADRSASETFPGKVRNLQNCDSYPMQSCFPYRSYGRFQKMSQIGPLAASAKQKVTFGGNLKIQISAGPDGRRADGLVDGAHGGEGHARDVCADGAGTR